LAGKESSRVKFKPYDYAGNINSNALPGRISGFQEKKYNSFSIKSIQE
jgi:hypothetical protein